MKTPVLTPKRAPFGERPASYLLVSLAVLIPCFWQSRVQAGDLGSHIYNAWLAQLIGRGQAPGLAVVRQTTNVLFDLLLATLFRIFGAAAAQRIAVSLAVLVFFWGAFAFIVTVSRRSWPIAVVLAMLAYGWVFHIGFFNFYLSLGLCLWVMALVWNPAAIRLLGALLLLILAYTAHAMPVAWTIGALAYAFLWRKLLSRGRRFLLTSALVGLLLMRFVIVLLFSVHSYTNQIWHITGADQLWIYGDRYLFTAAVLCIVGGWIGLDLWRTRSATLGDAAPLLPISIVTAAGIFLIPTAILLPQYNHQLAFVAQRMSLPLGVAVCALLARAPLRLWHIAGIAAVGILFFGSLYVDESALNDFEDQVDQLVAQIPPGQRVVLSVNDPDSEVNALTHSIDRACIGRCWSYANYEPSSAQFRIRVVGETVMAAPTESDSNRMQIGTYIVKPGDLPLVQILAARDGRLFAHTPSVGQALGLSRWSGL